MAFSPVVFFQALPECARPCLLNAIEETACALTNTTCICANEYIGVVTAACVSVNCTVVEQLATKNLTSVECGILPASHYIFVPFLVLFILMTCLFFALRILSKLLLGNWWWDDLFTFLAVLSCWSYTGIMLYLKRLGFGVDFWDVPTANIETIVKDLWFVSVLYILSRLFVRCAVILFYIRIFNNVNAHRVMVGLLAVNVCVNIPMLIPRIFSCHPISYAWDKWDGLHPGSCIMNRQFVWSTALLTSMWDFFIVLVPVPYVLRLQLSTARKVMITGMFGLGFIVLVVSFLRFTAIEKFVRSTNPTIDYVPMVVYSGIEIDVAVMVACAPTIPALVKYIKDRAKSKQSTTSRNTIDAASAAAQLRAVVVTTSIEQKSNFPALQDESDRYIPLDDTYILAQYPQYESHVRSEAWSGN